VTLNVPPRESSTPSASHRLKSGALGWANVAGLGIAIAISGQFSGWNFGLAAGGWGGILTAAIIMAVFYLGYTQCVAELAAAMPSAGGFETYCRRAFGLSAGYVVGMSVLVALAIAIGVVSNFTAAYAKSVFGIGAVESKVVLFAVVLGLQLRGVREAVGVTMIVGAIAVAVLVLFCGSMAQFAHAPNLVSHTGAGGLFPHGAFGILAAIPYALWMFLGVEQAALAAEETFDPGRTMPKALTIGVLTLLVVGLGVLVFGPAGAGTDSISTAADPLYAALTSPLAFGQENWLTRVIGTGALVGLIATFFSIVYASSRQLFSLARDGYLPIHLAATNLRHAPRTALFIVIGVGIAASFFPPEQLMLPIVFLFNVTFLLALAAFVRLRRREPDLHRPYRAVGGCLTAGVTTALSLIVLIACFLQQSTGLIYALVVYAVLIAQFVLFRRRTMLKPEEIPS
jgi:ethanolamine permease